MVPGRRLSVPSASLPPPGLRSQPLNGLKALAKGLGRHPQLSGTCRDAEASDGPRPGEAGVVDAALGGEEPIDLTPGQPLLLRQRHTRTIVYGPPKLLRQGFP